MALLLSDSDVRSMLRIKEVLKVVEDAFREKGLGKVQMPPKTYLFFKDQNGDLRIMPAFLPDRGAAGVKIVNSHPGNQRYGLPSVLGTVLLIDPKNGLPTAIIGANSLTSIRTGAAGGLAARYLARRNSRIVGMLGAGVQARTQLEAVLEVLPGIERVKVYDVNKENAARFVKEFPAGRGRGMTSVESPELAVRSSDLVITTTPSRSPIVERGWVEPGTHINAIGADAPGKQELDIQILLDGKVVPDDWEQAAHGGEMNVAVSQGRFSRSMIHGELGEVVCGKVKGRESRDEITIFDSTGLAIQDVAVAAHLCDRALKSNKGTKIDIWS